MLKNVRHGGQENRFCFMLSFYMVMQAQTFLLDNFRQYIIKFRTAGKLLLLLSGCFTALRLIFGRGQLTST